MTEQLLDGPDVGARLQEVGGKGVAEGVAGGALRDSGGENGAADRSLDGGLVKMMAAPVASRAMQVATRGGKDPLEALPDIELQHGDSVLAATAPKR